MSYSDKPPYGGKSRSDEGNLHTEKIQVERKTFIFTLKENPRGRFLRITEDVGGRRDTIILPATGLKEFSDVLQGLCTIHEGLPPEEAPEEFGS